MQEHMAAPLPPPCGHTNLSSPAMRECFTVPKRLMDQPLVWIHNEKIGNQGEGAFPQHRERGRWMNPVLELCQLPGKVVGATSRAWGRGFELDGYLHLVKPC